jgi:flagellar motor switch protein FliG
LKRNKASPAAPEKTNPDKPGGLLKTGAKGGLVKTVPAGEQPDSKCRRVAKFLILIGGDEAAQVLANLDPAQVEEVSREIASIRGITAEEGAEILDEFRSLLSHPYGFFGASSGGLETARRLLYETFGPEKGETLLNKAVPGSPENPFSFIEDFSAEQIRLLIKDEVPAAAALILSRVSPKTSASVLANISGERKPEIVRRIAHQGEVAPEVLEQVAAALKQRARSLGRAGDDSVAIDGMNTLAAILKSGDYSFGDRLINELEEEVPELGRDLKEKLYTLDDVLKADDKPLQEKLRTMENKDIALLLKGKQQEFTEKILSNVSAQRRAMIAEEGEYMGAVLKRDSDMAASNFLAWFRQQREEGHILLTSDDEIIE